MVLAVAKYYDDIKLFAEGAKNTPPPFPHPIPRPQGYDAIAELGKFKMEEGEKCRPIIPLRDPIRELKRAYIAPLTYH